MFQMNITEKLKKHIVFIEFFSPKNPAIYEIILKNFVEPCRPQVTIWHMHIVCWVPKATNTHLEYVILIAFQWQQQLCEHALMLHLYIHCLFCFLYWET